MPELRASSLRLCCRICFCVSLGVELPIVRNRNESSRVIWACFGGERATQQCLILTELKMAWTPCPVTSHSLDHFCCVLFHEVFCRCFRLLQPGPATQKVVCPPRAEGVISSPWQSIQCQNLTSGVPSHVIAHSQSFLDSAGIHLSLIKMTLCRPWDAYSSTCRSIAAIQDKILPSAYLEEGTFANEREHRAHFSFVAGYTSGQQDGGR